MSFEFIKELPHPEEIKNKYSLTKELIRIKKNRDKEIGKILRGESDKLILLIGPCSADYEASVMEYVYRLAELQEKIKDTILIIPRVYTNKPRTICSGYLGMMLQPVPYQETSALEGIDLVRRLHLNIIKTTSLTSADEMLYPELMMYTEDLLSYVVVGARSVENQHHRLIASGINYPVGMKNPVSGNLEAMVCSVHSANLPQKFVYRDWVVKTNGNPYAHSILRGGVDLNGNYFSNYEEINLLKLNKLCLDQGIINPIVMIDCNHANSGKQYDRQGDICFDVLKTMRENTTVHSMVKGFMVESYLEDGKQEVNGKLFGKSLTDPCLGWKKTKRLILEIAANLGYMYC